MAETCADTACRRRAGLSSVSVSESALSLDEYFSKFQERLYTGQGPNSLSKRIEASLALTTILVEVDCSFSTGLRNGRSHTRGRGGKTLCGKSFQAIFRDIAAYVSNK